MTQKIGRIGILVVAYNAESTLTQVLDRIPPEFHDQIHEVIVSDDSSTDGTFEVGEAYKESSQLPLTVLRQPINLGYGGNQKVGYRLAIDQGLDVIVLLHGDGQYAPEKLPEMVAPFEDPTVDAVFGSRMMDPGGALRGNMPLYKYVGNRVLSKFENVVLGTDLSEFHSGYRAYRVSTLKELPFEKNSDGFDFDTEIIIQLHDAGKKIVEIPIPTYYGDEICRVNGLGYAAAVAKDVVAYRLQKAGFGDGNRVALREGYDFKGSPESSHGRVLEMLATRTPGKVLDLGCSGGLLAERLLRAGFLVTGVDAEEVDGVRGRVSSFVLADLNHGVPEEAGSGFDLVLACDVLEHLRDPGSLLRDAGDHLVAGGTAIICVPNFSHWYPRIRSTLGIFDYDQRGILDESHLRFFTKRSIRRLVEREGFSVEHLEAVGLPLDVLGVQKGWRKLILALEKKLLSLWPTMFGYQFILELSQNADSRR
jgi:glycosyltransferase involved in cell wall biosynthesis